MATAWSHTSRPGFPYRCAEKAVHYSPRKTICRVCEAAKIPATSHALTDDGAVLASYADA
jgi:hypothetical protein